jgi:hypothetical protein
VLLLQEHPCLKEAVSKTQAKQVFRFTLNFMLLLQLDRLHTHIHVIAREAYEDA